MYGTVALELTHLMRGDDANQRRAIVDAGAELPKGFKRCVSPGNLDPRIRLHFAEYAGNEHPLGVAAGANATHQWCGMRDLVHLGRSGAAV